MRIIKTLSLLFVFFTGMNFLAGCSSPAKSELKSEKILIIPGGVEIQLENLPVKKVRLETYANNIVRVTASPTGKFEAIPDYLMVNAKPVSVPMEIKEEGNHVILKTDELLVKTDLSSGRVSFFDKNGKQILAEANRGDFDKVIDEPGKADKDSFSVHQSFIVDDSEGFYGLGQQQDGIVNYAGHNVELTTFNMRSRSFNMRYHIKRNMRSHITKK